MPKLTLNIAADVVKRAKRLAVRQDTSVSQLVEQFLDIVSREERVAADEPPVLRALRGSLKGVSLSDYRRHIERKYR